MSEITSNAGESRPGKGSRRAKRHSTKVDFTPMVDLGFLLITFFILTSQLQEPKAMSLLMPADGTDGTKSGESTVITVVPLDETNLFYCNGDLQKSLRENTYGVITRSAEIRQIIQKKKIALSASSKFNSEDLMLIIKPAKEANLKSIIDILDEVAINRLKHYAFVDLDVAEEKFLKEKGLIRQ
jgi:biopolymer transport protein ExbD